MLPTATSVNHKTTPTAATYVDVPKGKPFAACAVAVVAVLFAYCGGLYGAMAFALPAFVLCWFALHWLARWNGLVAIPVASFLTIIAMGYAWLQTAGHVPSPLG